MENFNISAQWTQPYRTWMCLWEHLETEELLQQMDSLEEKITSTDMAIELLSQIGIKVPKSTNYKNT